MSNYCMNFFKFSHLVGLLIKVFHRETNTFNHISWIKAFMYSWKYDFAVISLMINIYTSWPAAWCTLMKSYLRRYIQNFPCIGKSYFPGTSKLTLHLLNLQYTWISLCCCCNSVLASSSIPDDGCWSPGSLCYQDISNHSFDCVIEVYPCLPTGINSIASPIWLLRNDRKCKCIFMFLRVNSKLQWLTHCGPVMPYSNTKLDQHWLR